MTRKLSIEFKQAHEPIRALVTKFGGQPVWCTSPQWPMSKSTGRPMRFIGQIALDPWVLGESPNKMAYLFMTDDDDAYVDATWEAEGGENAIVLQPANHCHVECTPLTNGPTLYQMVQRQIGTRMSPVPCEFGVTFTQGEDPEYIPEESQWELPEELVAEYSKKLDGNKIGGNPGFLQGDEYPPGGPWKLLLQLDSTKVPFAVNFGDAGIGYAFIANDGANAKFLWQCA